MKIGIIGLGIVGGAVHYGMMKLGHTCLVHDLKLSTKMVDLLEADICFICVPTPSLVSGECDVSAVVEVVDTLVGLSYGGIIAIKSTVSPGTTQLLINKHANDKICFVPEFLRERCAFSDFVEDQDLCIIGTVNKAVFQEVSISHGTLPKKTVMTSPTEAELCKYFNNIYNATHVTLANSFYEVCKKLGVNYTNVKNAIVHRKHIPDLYLECNENFRGFGGPCLPKDTLALAFLCEKYGIPVRFFRSIIEENLKYNITVFDGMRKA